MRWGAAADIFIEPHVDGNIQPVWRRKRLDAMVPIGWQEQRAALLHIDSHRAREARERKAAEVGLGGVDERKMRKCAADAILVACAS